MFKRVSKQFSSWSFCIYRSGEMIWRQQKQRSLSRSRYCRCLVEKHFLIRVLIAVVKAEGDEGV